MKKIFKDNQYLHLDGVTLQFTIIDKDNSLGSMSYFLRNEFGTIAGISEPYVLINTENCNWEIKKEEIKCI